MEEQTLTRVPALGEANLAGTRFDPDITSEQRRIFVGKKAVELDKSPIFPNSFVSERSVRFYASVIARASFSTLVEPKDLCFHKIVQWQRIPMKLGNLAPFNSRFENTGGQGEGFDRRGPQWRPIFPIWTASGSRVRALCQASSFIVHGGSLSSPLHGE